MLMTIVLGLAVGVPFGYVLQRGGFCMNTAFRSLVFEKDHSLFRAYVLILLINVVVVNLLDELAIITVTYTPFFWLAVIIGGLIFGTGMVLSGGCVSGTWYRTGKGMFGSLLALIGFAFGATAMRMGFLREVLAVLRQPELDVYGQEATLFNIIPIDHWALKWGIIVALVLGGAAWLLAAPKQKYQIGWGWRKTGLVLGVMAAAAWIFSGLTGRDYWLSFTQPTISLVSFTLAGDTDGLNWGSFFVMGVPLGAFIAAKVTGEFALRVPSAGRMLQQLGGGIVMGIGASLAGGCNIGHGVTGVSTLAVSSIVATLFTVLGVWAATYVIYTRASLGTSMGVPLGKKT